VDSDSLKKTDSPEPVEIFRVVPVDSPKSTLLDQLPTTLPVKDLLEYLRSATVVFASAATVPDKHSPRLLPLSVAWFCDGTWLWSSELIGYVERHHIQLPEEFITHVGRTRVPPRLDPALLSAAANHARRLQPPPREDVVSRHRNDSLRTRLLAFVSPDRSRKKPEVSAAWQALQDVDALTNRVDEMVQKLVFELTRHLGNFERQDLIAAILTSPGPLFPMGLEMVEEVLRWAYNERVDGHMDAGTRTFYSLILAGRLADVLKDQGVDLNFDELLAAL